MLRVKPYPSLALVFMGYVDWLTTIVGIAYFGAVEVNPFFADLTRTNLVAFTAVKLATTVFVGLLYYFGERLLQKLKDKNIKSSSFVRITLRVGYTIATIVFLMTILNNILVVAHSL